MDAMRQKQIEIFRTWSPARRLEAAAQLIDLAVALRSASAIQRARESEDSHDPACDVSDVR